MNKEEKYLILGAGISGIAASYYLGDKSDRIIERNSYPGGHIHTWSKNGYTWDEGPHVQFGRHPVSEVFFKRSGESSYCERIPVILNYWRGNWIRHPSQINLFDIPNPQRDLYVESLTNAKVHSELGSLNKINNYWEWLIFAYGEMFSYDFPRCYTEKYWTVHPRELSTTWLGPRMHVPTKEEIRIGACEGAGSSAHYLNKYIYPIKGGYMNFVNDILDHNKLKLSSEVCSIDLNKCMVYMCDDSKYSFTSLINTIPLPEFIRLCRNTPKDVIEAANQLLCTELILVNVEVPHMLDNKFHWCYVYDENLLSTRITSYGQLSPNNVPPGCSGLQVEVYGSRRRPFIHSHETIGEIVIKELKNMGLIKSDAKINYHTHYSKYANVVFDLKRESYLETIWSWLASFGLKRELSDLDYGPNWESLKLQPQGTLMMAGRFAQWNYSWTHDCVLRAHYLSECLKNQKFQL